MDIDMTCATRVCMTSPAPELSHPRIPKACDASCASLSLRPLSTRVVWPLSSSWWNAIYVPHWRSTGRLAGTAWGGDGSWELEGWTWPRSTGVNRRDPSGVCAEKSAEDGFQVFSGLNHASLVKVPGIRLARIVMIMTRTCLCSWWDLLTWR